THEIAFTPKGFVWDFAVADWDRDGKPDLLVRQAFLDGKGKHGIYWYKNLGGERARAGLPKLAEGKLLVEIESDMHVQGFCVADWNGDGWPDLIVTRDVYSPATPDGKQDCRGTVWLYLRE
ncbi:MAG TPA: VCBS repeat-containing protein, partial [Gemmataceae bacterium]|nr:VCBS repeat-containing protein [Gemmataceae bacterium]